MSRMEMKMTHDADTERLGRKMAETARMRPEFIGSALALWERANPGRSLLTELRCDEAALWRLAVTPRPQASAMAETAMGIGPELGVNPLALVNILRFANSAGAFASASDDGEMLMAALDDEGDEVSD